MARTAVRPTPARSNGAATTPPPASLARAAASSALSTLMLVFQAAGVAGSGAAIAATSGPRSWRV